MRPESQADREHESLTERARAAISAMPETILRDKVVRPVFERRGWRFRAPEHGPNEVDHKLDLLAESPRHAEVYIGIQVKCVPVRGAAYVKNQISLAAWKALKHPFGADARLVKYYWITSTRLSPRHSGSVQDWLAQAGLEGRVEIWDIDRLIKEMHAVQLDALTPVGLLACEDQLRMRVGHASALFYCMRGLRLSLSCNSLLPWRDRLSYAREYTARALATLDGFDGVRPLYFSRVLQRYFETWRLLLKSYPEKEANALSLPLLFRSRVGARKLAALPRGHGLFLHDAYAVLGQMELLERHYARTPSGLASLQVCDVLLRMGWPADGPNLKQRLDELAGEFVQDGGPHIDGSCSICTAVAVSCLLLADSFVAQSGRGRGRASPALLWLRSLKGRRYAHQARYTDCGLHYAGMVLGAFVDAGGEFARDIASVMDVLLGRAAPTHGGIPEVWLEDRNISTRETCTYICVGLLRHLLRGGSFTEMQRRTIAGAVSEVVRGFQSDGVDDPARLFETRESLPVLALGLCCEPREGPTLELLRRILFGGFHDRLVELLLEPPREGADSSMQRLWDSSVDRTRSFVEGWLLTWEALLWLEERGRNVAELLNSPSPTPQATPKSLFFPGQ